jgi:predicted DNA-binding transcriptional regulator AlpA
VRRGDGKVSEATLSKIDINTNSMPRRVVRGWDGASRKVSKSRTQLWRDVRDNRFPAPFQLGSNSVAWFEDELDAWLSSRPRRTYGFPEVAANRAPARNG